MRTGSNNARRFELTSDAGGEGAGRHIDECLTFWPVRGKGQPRRGSSREHQTSSKITKNPAAPEPFFLPATPSASSHLLFGTLPHGKKGREDCRLSSPLPRLYRDQSVAAPAGSRRGQTVTQSRKLARKLPIR